MQLIRASELSFVYATIVAGVLAISAAGGAIAAAPVPKTLYEGAAGKLPNESPWQWTFLGDGTPAMAPQGLVSLSTSNSEQGGFNSFGVGTLDRNAGFRIEFGLQMIEESHLSSDRSGTSVIVLDGSALGVELSFWADQVFVKNADPPFSHGEGRTLDTTIERRYTLQMQGDAYSLATPGMTTLSGSLRNYLNVADTFVEQFVYGQRNYIFVGDNTTSAGAHFMLRDMVLSPVPEPSQLAAMLAGLGLLAIAGKRRRKL